MKPEEKAKELVDKFSHYADNIFADRLQNAKYCALIAVDEILNVHMWKYNSVEPYKYWQQVKQEIEKL